MGFFKPMMLKRALGLQLLLCQAIPALDWEAFPRIVDEKHPLKIEVPAPSSLEVIPYQKGFSLTVGYGSGLKGLDVFTLSGHQLLHVVHRYGQPSVCYRISAAVSDDEARHFIDTLNKAHVGALSSSYSAAVADGTQCIIAISSDGQERVTYCDNYFPPAARATLSLIDDLLDAKSPTLVKTPLDEAAWKAVVNQTWRLTEK